jgi:site-specific DNA recombinase
VWRLTAAETRETYDMPELRIVSDDLWQSVQDAIARRSNQPLVRRQRPPRLLSGLVECGLCGGAFTVFANDRMCCSRGRETGTCGSKATIRVDELERRVLAGLQGQLLSPEAVSLLVHEYHLERERNLRESGKARRGLERRLRETQAAVDRLVAAIADGGGEFAELRNALARKSAERELAERELAELEAPSTIALHPHIADAYRARIERLAAGGAAGMSDAIKADIRGLIEAVYVRPADAGGAQVEIVGSLEAAIALASGAPPPKRGTLSAMLVAGDRFQRNRQRRSIMA